MLVRPLPQLSAVNAFCWLGHFSFSFVYSMWNACYNRIPLRWWTLQFYLFAFLKKTILVVFAACFKSLSICTVKRRPMSSEAFEKSIVAGSTRLPWSQGWPVAGPAPLVATTRCSPPTSPALAATQPGWSCQCAFLKDESHAIVSICGSYPSKPLHYRKDSPV